MSLFVQDADTFTSTMLLNVDHLQKQLDKAEFQEDGSMTAFLEVYNQFQKFIDSHVTLDYDSQMTEKYFVEYTGIEYDRRVNNRLMSTQESTIDMGKAVHADLVVTESNGTESTVQVDNGRSGNDTDADDAVIKPIYNEEPMAKVYLTADCNIFAIGQQHTEKPKIINDGRVDQYHEQRQVKTHMFDSSLDSQTNDYSKQSLASKNSLLKQTVARFQKDFSKMEAHCIALELKSQNQALKSGQHGQVLNDESNKAKIKKEIDVLETMNIELAYKSANFRKENETLKKHYKDLYDSIKITRSKTIEQTTSLLANNADLKAQIQEKVFGIAALKNDLRKLKGNGVDTKFANTSVLGKPVLQPLRNKSVVRQSNAFKYERPQMSKQQFASQVDVNHNLSKPVTQHSLPKKSESAFAQPDHMIASSSSRNNSKNMSRFSSNDMVQNHYLDEAKKKTREKDRNSKPSVMTSARFQRTTADSKPKPRSTNHSSRSLPMSKSSCVMITAMPKGAHSKSPSSFSDPIRFFCSTCHKCVFNANHEACITKLLKEVNSRAKIQSHKTRDSNKPIDQKSHTQTPGRWKPTGRIFKSVGFRWLPTGKLFDSCTSKVEREPTPGFNADISNIHECKQILDLSAGTSINVTKEQSLAISAGILWNVNKANLRVCTDPAPTRHAMASVQNSTDPAPTRHAMASVQNSTDLGPTCQKMASVQISSDPAPEYQTMVVSKSSAVTAADAPNQQPQAENDQVADDEFINIFSTLVQDQGETSSRHVDSSNMHTFYQRYPFEQRWTKDHTLEQVIGNPSQSVRTRRQLESDAEMCMFALTVSRTEPKNIKEAMADSAWIESMQEELHQFDRLDVWELVDRPLCTNIINLMWLWKNKRDEENTSFVDHFVFQSSLNDSLRQAIRPPQHQEPQ
nr:Gag-Pol polyprotein [Tanacetum cinerariifolium]